MTQPVRLLRFWLGFGVVDVVGFDWFVRNRFSDELPFFVDFSRVFLAVLQVQVVRFSPLLCVRRLYL